MFKKVKDFPNYGINKEGKVYNYNTDKLMKVQTDDKGYTCVSLTNDSGKHKCYIHRLVAEAFIPGSAKDVIDHIDNDRTNNNVSNLRHATYQENNRNASLSKTSTTKIKGVTKDNSGQRFKAQIFVDGKNIHLGYFDTKADAEEARAKAEKRKFGEFGKK